MMRNQKLQEMTLKHDARHRDLGYRMQEAAFNNSCLGKGDPGDKANLELDDEMQCNVNSGNSTHNHTHYYSGDSTEEPAQPVQPKPAPYPQRSFWEKWALPIVGALALTWFIARDFIKPEQTKQGLKYRPSFLELLDDEGNPAPTIEVEDADK